MNLNTLSEQIAHYRAVRARLWSLPPPRSMPEIPPPAEPEPEPEEQQPVADGRTVADIILDEVAAKHKIPRVVLKAHLREKEIVAARHEAWWRMSLETSLSLPMMGKKLGGFDHTTVLHGIHKHEKRMRAERAE